MEIKIRKTDIFIENVETEMNQKLEGKNIVATIALTAENPYANMYMKDLSDLSDWAASMVDGLLSKLLTAAGLEPKEITSFGKAAIIGINGEVEHAAALLHSKVGTQIRKHLDGITIMPGTKKIGLPGTTIDIPYDSKSDAASSIHACSIEMSVPNSPMANEFLMMITIASNTRPLARA